MIDVKIWFDAPELTLRYQPPAVFEGVAKSKSKTLPLTGAGVVSRIYSDYAVLDITDDGFKVIQLNEDITIEYLQSVTDGNICQ